MDEFNNSVMPAVVEDNGEIINYGAGGFDILELAKMAEEIEAAQRKIIAIALRSTTKKDWVRIGSGLYLQESGATKIANMFGISWGINEGYPQTVTDRDGYKSFKYRMTFKRKDCTIEAEGSRSGADEFFAGKKDETTGKHKKSPDEVDYGHVERAALTSCINNGIKRIIPGLRNVDEDELKKYGIDFSNVSGYTFKTGSQGGKDARNANDSGITCENCGAPITQKVASYAQSKFGYKLCMNCQKVGNIKQIMDEKFNNPTPAPAQQKPQTRTQKPPVNLDESRAVPVPGGYEEDYPEFLS